MSDHPFEPAHPREALLETMLSHLADFAYLFDLEGRFLYANRPLLDLWGLSLEQAVGKNFHDLHYPTDLADCLHRQIQEVIDTRGVTRDETLYTSPVTGQTEYYEYVFTPVFGSDGQIQSVAGCTRLITDRKTAEIALAESHRRYSEVLESIKNYAIFTLQPDGTVATWNLGAARIFGYQEAEIIGRDGSILWTLEDRARNAPEEEMLITRQTGRAADERWHQRRDGTRFFASGSLNTIIDSSGQLTGYTKICRDITEQREIAADLLTTRRRLDAALIAGEIGTWVFEVPTDRVFADKNLAEFYGVSEADANGGPLERYLAAIHPDDLERVKASIGSVFESGGTDFESDYRVLSPQGERYIIARGRVERNAEGVVIRMPGVALDITERKRAEAELSAVQERFSLAVNAAELGTFHVPLPADQIIWSDKCNEHFFFPAGSHVTFEQALEHIHPDDREWVHLAFEESVTNGTFYDIEHRTISETGDERWIHVIGRVFRDGDGQSTRFDGVTMDVTARRRLETEREESLLAERVARTEAERTSQVKDEFLATLSHELRTPLNAILGWTQVLLTSSTGPEDTTRGLEIIKRNARAQTQIIEDLLDMSRIISGKVRLDVQPLDLAGVVEAAIQTTRPAAEAKGIRIRAVLDPLLSDVNGDPNRLQQVFWNLLSNAVKFTSKGGSVTVTLSRIESHLEVNVTDTGEGINPEFLPHVFERFRQSDASTTRRHGGLGLGLAIVRQLVELHGGTVHVHSEGQGHGATFSVRLPANSIQIDSESSLTERSRHSLEETTPLPLDKWDFSGLRILVLDDEPEARGLVQRLLQDCGATVTTAANTAEAYDILTRTRPDLLISDIGMPGEDGYSLIRRIRELSPDQGGATPAIALTAYARTEDRMRAIIQGFQFHLAKPVEAAELLTLVASLASRLGNQPRPPSGDLPRNSGSDN